MIPFLTLLACGTPSTSPTPTVAPKPDLSDELRLLRVDIGRAQQNEERGCAAVSRAITTAEKVTEYRSSTGGLPMDELHGLTVTDTDVRPDWTELALALGEGHLATAVITVGGLEALETNPCVDPERIESWTRRLPVIVKMEGCAQAPLMTSFLAALDRLQHMCTCAPVDPITASKLGTRLSMHDADLASRYGAWATTHQVCVRDSSEGVPAP